MAQVDHLVEAAVKEIGRATHLAKLPKQGMGGQEQEEIVSRKVYKRTTNQLFRDIAETTKGPIALKVYDAGKKVSCINRHIAVDTQGLPHAMAVTIANVTDRKGVLQALGRYKLRLGRVQVCWSTAAMWASLLRRACRTSLAGT